MEAHYEFNPLVADIHHSLEELSDWMKPRSVATSLMNQPGSSTIKPDPLGVTLVIAPWNYPVLLCLQPVSIHTRFLPTAPFHHPHHTLQCSFPISCAPSPFPFRHTPTTIHESFSVHPSSISPLFTTFLFSIVLRRRLLVVPPTGSPLFPLTNLFSFSMCAGCRCHCCWQLCYDEARQLCTSHIRDYCASGQQVHGQSGG